MIGLSTQTHTYRHASVEKRLTKVIVTPISRLLPLYITSIGYDQAIYFPPPPPPRFSQSDSTSRPYRLQAPHNGL